MCFILIVSSVSVSAHSWLLQTKKTLIGFHSKNIKEKQLHKVVYSFLLTKFTEVVESEGKIQITGKAESPHISLKHESHVSPMLALPTVWYIFIHYLYELHNTGNERPKT